MKAFVLAAGFGTRLAPLTDSLPKALVPVAGKPMIAHVIDRLRAAGCDGVIVNAHHHAESLETFFAHRDYGVPVTVVRETDILGTGGGILHARKWLDDGSPFLVHNADIVSNADLDALMLAVARPGTLAALCVNRRITSRAVLFDEAMRFLGKEVWFPSGIPHEAVRFGFCGIHAVDPALFSLGFHDGFSDIFDIYRTAMSAGHHIAGVEHEGMWHDLGSIESITKYERIAAGAHK